MIALLSRSGGSPGGGCDLPRRNRRHGAALVYQHAIVRPGDLSRVDAAFFTANGFVSVVLAACGIADVLLRRARPPVARAQNPRAWRSPPKATSSSATSRSTARSASARPRSSSCSRGFHGTQILEDVDNPFLPDFYKKKKGAAFQTQLFFLLSRYQQQQEIAQIDLFSTLVVADYHFPKDKIFACLNLDDSELLIYNQLYTLLSESVRKPDLVIFLQGSIETCLKRIKKRPRRSRRR